MSPLAPFVAFFSRSLQNTQGTRTSLITPRCFVLLTYTRFFFFSPPHGTANNRLLRTGQVHPNGRMNYRGKETRADGSDPLAETAARAAELVDRAAIIAEVCSINMYTAAVGCDLIPGLYVYTWFHKIIVYKYASPAVSGTD